MPAHTPATATKRISLRLDPALAVEALLLQRLQALPRRRRSEWLRSLLVQGYLAESELTGQLHGGVAATLDAPRRPPLMPTAAFSFATWRAGPARREPIPDAPRAVAPEAVPVPVVPTRTDKPFAHLRKVVG